MLAAIVLSAAVALLWTFLARPKPADPAKTPPAKDAPANPPAPANGNANGGAAPAPPGPPAPAEPAKRQKAEAKPPFVVTAPAESTWLDAGFTTRGGALRFVRLKDVYEAAERDDPHRKPLDLFLPIEPDLLTGMVELDKDDTEGMRTTHWTLVSQSDREVVFSFLTSKGLKVTKTIRIPTGPDRFDAEIVVAVERVEGAPAAGETANVRILGSAGFGPEPPSHSTMDTPSEVF